MNQVTQMSDTEVYYSRKAAARYLESIGCPISPRTLAKMASNDNERRGPPYLRFRWRNVRYAKSDLHTWAKKQVTRVE
jgi:hypothetical protein